MTDISREAVDEALAAVFLHIGPMGDGLFIAAMLLALRAALDAAEADKARAVEAERDRCENVVLSFCGKLDDGDPYYIDLDSFEIEEMMTAIRARGEAK